MFYDDLYGLIDFISFNNALILVLFDVKKYPKTAGLGNRSLGDSPPLWDV